MELYKTINPYSGLGPAQTGGLNAINAVLSNPFSVDLLNDTIYTYLNTTYMGGDGNLVLEIMLKSVIPDAANALAYGSGYDLSDAQQELIHILLNGLAQAGADPDSIELSLLKTETEVASSGLNAGEQMPLMMGIAVARATLNYWKTEIPNGSSNWYTTAYFDPNAAVNMANLSKWTAAAAQGALQGFAKLKTINGGGPTNDPAFFVIGTLLGSIGVAAGKVMYRW